MDPNGNDFTIKLEEDSPSFASIDRDDQLLFEPKKEGTYEIKLIIEKDILP